MSDAANSYPALRQIAEQAARAGGRCASERFGRPMNIRRKPDGSEVSEADELSQAAVVREIRALRPDDAFVGEETFYETGLPTPTNEGICWVIDPIDGTRNYVRGISCYACAVAAVQNGEPFAAATYLPESNTMYSTSVGEPVFMNAAPVTAPLAETLGDRNPTPVVAVPSQCRPPVRDRAFRWLDEFVGRNYGSSAQHLAQVATGQLQGCMLADCKIWDIVGGVLLVRNGGGCVVGIDGEPIGSFGVASDLDLSRPCIAGATPELLAKLMSV